MNKPFAPIFFISEISLDLFILVNNASFSLNGSTKTVVIPTLFPPFTSVKIWSPIIATSFGVTLYWFKTFLKLLDRGFIKECGKDNSICKPNLYKTTNEFLDYFGLATIEDLPTLNINDNETDEKELFTSIYKEENE